MPAELKPVLVRQMEVYAGFLEYVDHHLGRLLDSIQKLNLMDDTLVYYIIGDHQRPAAEGTLNGTFNEMINFNGAGRSRNATISSWTASISSAARNHTTTTPSVSSPHALDTPYQWTKQVASHFGGTRNGTIVHWPKGIKGKGELRSQFHHVIDVAPTLLEAAGLPQPLRRRRAANAPSKAPA